MKTKKIAAVLLTCIMAIGLMAGCGASNTNRSGNEEADTNSENTKDTQQEMEKHWLYIIQLQEIQKMLLKR